MPTKIKKFKHDGVLSTAVYPLGRGAKVQFLDYSAPSIDCITDVGFRHYISPDNILPEDSQGQTHTHGGLPVERLAGVFEVSALLRREPPKGAE